MGRAGRTGFVKQGSTGSKARNRHRRLATRHARERNMTHGNDSAYLQVVAADPDGARPHHRVQRTPVAGNLQQHALRTNEGDEGGAAALTRALICKPCGSSAVSGWCGCVGSAAAHGMH